jgi:hypothetical protein
MFVFIGAGCRSEALEPIESTHIQLHFRKLEQETALVRIVRRPNEIYRSVSVLDVDCSSRALTLRLSLNL